MRLWYVAEPALDPSFFLDDLEEWARYRAVARRYLDEALQSGLPEAPAVLARVHLPTDALTAQATVMREPDAFRHFVYAELDRLLNPDEGRAEPPPAGWFDPALKPGPDIDMVAVHAEAERLRLAWSAGHQPGPRMPDSPVTRPTGAIPKRSVRESATIDTLAFARADGRFRIRKAIRRETQRLPLRTAARTDRTGAAATAQRFAPAAPAGLR
ncbi:hypothetical protein [Pseudofulvimonas gallinarii]|uniref:hypothetical protein n=1 Tax=Pseudofulvimonas gallinarii TaxID=634155 RepID=UPI00104987E1|nr:hypothetical protein [Pseudofulvimonas gallinarii]